MAEPIYLETGRKWSFAGAIEWPGWCRHAKGDGDPVAELVAYGARYREALALEGIDFDPPSDLEVVEELTGNSGTDWGVPSVVPDADRRPLDGTESDRQLAILRATWTAFDKAVVEAQGHALRKGPRGGGRDLPRLIEHCLESDRVYLSRLGSRKPKDMGDDPLEQLVAMRERAAEAFLDGMAGRPLRDPSRTREPWAPRWYIRYAAWHTIHHAWEIEDRRLDEPEA